MNIIKLQDMLRGVDDNALINYVQNPQGEVPSYLALSELQRRKDTRAKYQAEQAPESSVAEDLQQETMSGQSGLATLAGQPQPQMQMADQGVAGLDTGDMYQEDSFAGGGIVAFAGPQGSYVVPSKTPQQYYQAIQGNKNIGKSFMFNKFETPYDEAIKYYSGLKENANDPESKRQLDNAVQELQLQKYRFTRSKEDPTEKMMKTGLTGDASGKPISPPLTLKDLENKIAGNNPPPQNPVDEVKRGATGQNPPNETPVADTVDVTGDPYYFEKRPEDAAGTERDRYKQMYGDDPFVKRSQTRLESMDKRAKSMEDSNLGLALMSAGFKTMQGTSPYALANIGAGAEAGVKSYGESQKQLAELDEKRFNVDSKIADAERAVKLAAMQHGFKSEEYNKASNDLARTKVLEGKLDIEKYKVLAGTKETQAVMKQKSDFLINRDKYLKNNYSIKNALDVYNNKSAFDGLPENEKRSVLKNVETYNQYIQELKISYPLANMDLPTRDPFALLNRVR
jgi:hypothetical protein